MGVTAIKRIVNQTGDTVHLTNHENPGTNKTIDPRATVACDVWIPWCTSQADFDHNHYLTVAAGSRTTWMWQSSEASGDRVRVSPVGMFQANQTPIDGDASVNGNRTLYIRPYGFLEMERLPS
jgi:hypothetical protein